MRKQPRQRPGPQCLIPGERQTRKEITISDRLASIAEDIAREHGITNRGCSAGIRIALAAYNIDDSDGIEDLLG